MSKKRAQEGERERIMEGMGR